MKIKCPKCHKTFRAIEHEEKHYQKCPKCGCPLAVPAKKINENPPLLQQKAAGPSSDKQPDTAAEPVVSGEQEKTMAGEPRKKKGLWEHWLPAIVQGPIWMLILCLQCFSPTPSISTGIVHLVLLFGFCTALVGMASLSFFTITMAGVIAGLITRFGDQQTYMAGVYGITVAVTTAPLVVALLDATCKDVAKPPLYLWLLSIPATCVAIVAGMLVMAFSSAFYQGFSDINWLFAGIICGLVSGIGNSLVGMVWVCKKEPYDTKVIAKIVSTVGTYWGLVILILIFLGLSGHD